MPINQESILDSIKLALNIETSDTNFDAEITMHINSAFSELHQRGIGPDEGYVIAGNTEKWAEFLEEDKLVSSAKSYVFIYVKLLFDAPDRSFMITALEEQKKEIGWRLTAAVESKETP